MYIDKEGRKWFKGNLHLHTNASDGRRTKEEAFELYRQAGYDFIARTDHWKAGFQEDWKGMTVLSGCEFNLDPDAAVGVYHVVGVGFEKDPCLDRSMDVQTIIDGVHAAGGLAILCHPAWSLNTPAMLAGLRGVDMCEIYNSISGYPANCRPDSSLILDMLATAGIYWPISAADDTHFYLPTDTTRSFIFVQADSCSREDLLSAMRAGRFYASQGPRLKVRKAEDGSIEVESSEAESYTYFTNTPWEKNRCTVGKYLTSDRFVPGEKVRFVRVEATDTLGRKAWSQYVVL